MYTGTLWLTFAFLTANDVEHLFHMFIGHLEIVLMQCLFKTLGI